MNAKFLLIFILSQIILGCNSSKEKSTSNNCDGYSTIIDTIVYRDTTINFNKDTLLKEYAPINNTVEMIDTSISDSSGSYRVVLTTKSQNDSLLEQDVGFSSGQGYIYFHNNITIIKIYCDQNLILAKAVRKNDFKNAFNHDFYIRAQVRHPSLKRIDSNEKAVYLEFIVIVPDTDEFLELIYRIGFDGIITDETFTRND